MNKPGFEDYEDDGFGALGGEIAIGGGGAGQIDAVKTTVDARGIHSKCLCEHCGQSNQITTEWQEAVAGSLELAPPNWLVAPGGFLYAYVGCAKCGTELKIGYTPAEFKSRVLQGVQQGAITQAWLQNQLASLRPTPSPQQMPGRR